MARRRVAVRLGIPALIVALLALVALWRIGPPADRRVAGTAGITVPQEASLEDVEIRQVVNERTFWIESGPDESAFVVLDPDVKRVGTPRIAAGERVTLIGLVRPTPDPEQAIARWRIDTGTAKLLQERGTYLYVSEIRPWRKGY